MLSKRDWYVVVGSRAASDEARPVTNDCAKVPVVILLASRPGMTVVRIGVAGGLATAHSAVETFFDRWVAVDMAMPALVGVPAPEPVTIALTLLSVPVRSAPRLAPPRTPPTAAGNICVLPVGVVVPNHPFHRLV